MDKLKQWITLTVLGVLLVVAASWFLLVSPKQEAAAATQEQVTAQLSTNDSLEVALEVLKTKAEQLPEKRAALEEVTAKIPTGPDLPTLVRALTAAAGSSGVDLVSVTPGAPALAVTSTPVAPVAPGAPPAAPPASGTVPAAPGAPATPGAPAAPGVAGTLAVIPITINAVGGYFEIGQFLSAVEDLPRALRVSNLTLAPGTGPSSKDRTVSTSGGPTLTSTITGSVFMATGAAPAPVAPPSAAPTS